MRTTSKYPTAHTNIIHTYSYFDDDDDDSGIILLRFFFFFLHIFATICLRFNHHKFTYIQ